MLNPSQLAIDNLTELALYYEGIEGPGFGHLIDDELYYVAQAGTCGMPIAVYNEALSDGLLRRMYFLFLAEMLKTPWTYVPPQQKPPFDGVTWLFENHWITFEDVQRVRKAEVEYNEET